MGEHVKHQWEKTVVLSSDGGANARATFQVLDVTKPLLSVAQLLDTGNMVIFSNDGCFIKKENRVQEMERVVQELQTTADVTTVFDRPGAPFLQKTNKPASNGPEAASTGALRND